MSRLVSAVSTQLLQMLPCWQLAAMLYKLLKGDGIGDLHAFYRGEEYLALLFCAGVHLGLLDVGAFVELNFSVFLLSVAMAAITFFCSCSFDESRSAIAVSAVILVGFFVVSVIARIGHGEGVYGIIERFSIYYLLRARPIVEGQVNLWLNSGLLIGIAAAGLGGGVLRFARRDLPL